MRHIADRASYRNKRNKVLKVALVAFFLFFLLGGIRRLDCLYSCIKKEKTLLNLLRG